MKLIRQLDQSFKLFLGITYGIPYIMCIFMAYGYFTGKDLTLFPTVQMLCPAAGVILAVVTGNKNKALIPWRFFTIYLAMTVIGIFCAVMSVFVLNKELNTLFNILIVIGSIVLLSLVVIEDELKLKAYGLLGRSWSNILPISLLFSLLCLIRTIIYFIDNQLVVLTKELFTLETMFQLVFMVLNFWLSFVLFFGEEYGWRYYLQPLVQKKFGALKATFIIGFMWGIWHLPLNMFYYNTLDDALLSVMLQIISATISGIFFAYFYMKTQNIWCPIILHYLNNTLASIYPSSATESGEIAVVPVIAAMTVINLLLFGWPFFTKFYRDPKNRSETLEEQVAKYE
ncbi:lysostaphin resistance A-like protein [Enterococcus sp. AZ109]|uniref:CPBP family intramembrane glutamic endopeptidase n=1 Tax=Enterococcus sp. AZ109 TaxID=2774634 RepID=UPI003F2809FA